jgi:3-carboxy-cis,cis-muconate cycloisomerase
MNPGDYSLTDVQHLFSRRALWQAWLDVEAALARVQGEMGMIPVEATAEIARRATLSEIDADELEQDVERTRAPIVSLVRALAAVCDGDAGNYVHWGATTQNVIQTGRILQMRKMHRALCHRLGGVLGTLADLAEKGADTIMAGRTQRRHALPITFGFKVAGWIEEFLRHEERFREVEKRLFRSQFGGAIGAMQSFGDDGPELNRRLAERLDLAPDLVPVRSSTDHIAEYVLVLALQAATCAKIARDLYTLMADEIGEVTEGLGDTVIGSSTMPQKVNSKIAVKILAKEASLRTHAPLALEGMQPSHEGDAANNMMLVQAVDTACPLAFEIMCAMEDLLSGLRVMPERMRRNLDRTGGMIVAENAMMTLAPVVGRQKAHDLVHHAAAESSRTDRALFDILCDDETVRSSVSKDALRAALDPGNYTGHSTDLALQCAKRATTAAKRLRSGKSMG